MIRFGSLFFLAVVFTVGLTFATVELPLRLDALLQRTIPTPGVDSHADTVSQIKAELFMAHYHIRAFGYGGFMLLVGLIIAGFSTKRTTLAALGAVGVMLPCFAQFAYVMFFLAGLGMLNALWLPVLDLTPWLQDLGLVINAPDHFLRWVLGFVGVHSLLPRAIFFIGTGIFLFVAGVYAWLTNRAEGDGVADFWIYRLSRHPQYLGWIIWTYGAYVLIQRMHYPRRSWGIGASLPWLLSTMVIVGVAMMEELDMKRRHGCAYEDYRRGAPFLLPIPRFLHRIFMLPLRVSFKKDHPDRKREVAFVVGFYTALLMVLSSVFYAGGLRNAISGFASQESRERRVEDLYERVREEPNNRRRYHLASRLGAEGALGVESLLRLLDEEDPGLRALAAEVFEQNPTSLAVPALGAVLTDSVENVRFRSVLALNAISDPDAVPYLLPLLDDPVGHVRISAFGALARMNAPEVLHRAPGFIAAEEGWALVGILGALGATGSPDAVPLLVPHLTSDSEWIRQEVVIALYRIGSPPARRALEKATNDDDYEVRVYASAALKRLQG